MYMYPFVTEYNDINFVVLIFSVLTGMLVRRENRRVMNRKNSS